MQHRLSWNEKVISISLVAHTLFLQGSNPSENEENGKLETGLERDRIKKAQKQGL